MIEKFKTLKVIKVIKVINMDNNEDKGLSNSRSISEETKFVSSIQQRSAEEKERWLRSKEDVNALTVTTTLLDDTEECSICLELLGDNYEITRCGHKFHTHCLTRWFERGRIRCPNCRSNLEKQVFYCRYCDQFEDIYEDFPKCECEGCVDRVDDLYNYLSGINTAAGASDFIDDLRYDMMREIEHHCITRIHGDMLLCTKCNNWMYKYIKCPDCGDLYCPRNGDHGCGMFEGWYIPSSTSPEDYYDDSDDERSH